MAFAFGRIGLTPVEFYDLSWYEYDCMVDGYNKSLRESWEQVLFNTYTNIQGNPYIQKGLKPGKFKEYVASVLDGVSSDFEITMEELEIVKKNWGLDK